MTEYRLGVIGDPIDHSLSPQIHNLFAEQTNLKIDYQPYRVSSENLNSFVKDFFESGGDGLNVTLPHKVQCSQIATSTSPIVDIIGAANTLKSAKRSKDIFAESTDGNGLIQDLQEKSKIGSANILILGAGGSALSIIPSIADCLPKNILMDNRSKEKIQPLIERFNNLTINNSMIDNIDHFEDDIDIVINATSAGFSGAFNWYRDLNLSKETFFYDLSYTKDNSKTPFLNWAIQYSDNYSDGFGMLINQAALSYELWTGIMPGTTINKSDLIND